MFRGMLPKTYIPSLQRMGWYQSEKELFEVGRSSDGTWYYLNWTKAWVLWKKNTLPDPEKLISDDKVYISFPDGASLDSGGSLFSDVRVKRMQEDLGKVLINVQAWIECYRGFVKTMKAGQPERPTPAGREYERACIKLLVVGYHWIRNVYPLLADLERDGRFLYLSTLYPKFSEEMLVELQLLLQKQMQQTKVRDHVTHEDGPVGLDFYEVVLEVLLRIQENLLEILK